MRTMETAASAAGGRYVVAMEVGSLQPQDVSLRLDSPTAATVTLVKRAHARLLDALRAPSDALLGLPQSVLRPEMYTLSVPLPQGVVVMGVQGKVPVEQDGMHYLWALDKVNKTG